MSHRRTQAVTGASFVEFLMVLALLGILALAAGLVLDRQRSSSVTVGLARTAMEQARLLSVYRGVNHFLVLDPGGRVFPRRCLWYE